MYKFFLGVASVTLLAGCNQRTDTGWILDCEKYSSYDQREKDLCEKNRPKASPGGVVIDPNDFNMYRPDEREIGK